MFHFCGANYNRLKLFAILNTRHFFKANFKVPNESQLVKRTLVKEFLEYQCCSDKKTTLFFTLFEHNC